MEDKEIIGINVTPADCFIEPATESTYKILQFFGKEILKLGGVTVMELMLFPVNGVQDQKL